MKNEYGTVPEDDCIFQIPKIMLIYLVRRLKAGSSGIFMKNMILTKLEQIYFNLKDFVVISLTVNLLNICFSLKIAAFFKGSRTHYLKKISFLKSTCFFSMESKFYFNLVDEMVILLNYPGISKKNR